MVTLPDGERDLASWCDIGVDAPLDYGQSCIDTSAAGHRVVPPALLRITKCLSIRVASLVTARTIDALVQTGKVCQPFRSSTSCSFQSLLTDLEALRRPDEAATADSEVQKLQSQLATMVTELAAVRFERDPSIGCEAITDRH